jgi:hypothetical protein
MGKVPEAVAIGSLLEETFMYKLRELRKDCVCRTWSLFDDTGLLLQLVGRSVRHARDGVILKSTTNNGGLP